MIKKLLLSYLFFLSICFSETISGFVFDKKTNKPIPNVNLFISNQQIGTSSKEDGSFALNYSLKDKVFLEVSHIAYSNRTITLNKNMTKIQIMLDEIFFEANDVVVTSTRTNKLHKDAPIATEIITTKDLIDSGANNVAEFLSTRSGVSLQTSVEGGSMLNILGMDSRYILILIDGQSITGKFNSRIALDQISINQVKKIEIIKGPSSSLYGSEAMAGVVNIITNNEMKNEGIELNGRYGGSEFNLKNKGLGYGSSNIKLSGSKKISKLNILLNAEIENLKTDKTIQQIDIDNINKQSLLTNLSWDISSSHKTSLRNILYNHQENGASALMKTNTYITRNNLLFSHNWFLSKFHSFSHSLQYQLYKRKYLQERPWNQQIITEDLTSESNIEYESSIYKKITNGEINCGLEISQSNYSSDRIENGKQTKTTNSFFLQYDTYINKKLNIIIGTRFDKYSGYNLVINPRFAFMYSPSESWKFRSSWGKGFRSPTFMERFIDWNHVQFGYQVIGNPDLKPELSEGYTMGMEYNVYTQYQASFIIYYNKFENLIQDYAIEPSILSYQNINQAEYKGIEIQNRWQISSTSVSSWGLNIIDNRNKNGTMLPNTQPISSYFRFSYQHPHLKYNFSINTKWVGSYKPTKYDTDSGTYIISKKISDYFIFDGNWGIRVQNIMDVKIGIKNLGDYTNSQIGPFIGRSFYLEIIKKIL